MKATAIVEEPSLPPLGDVLDFLRLVWAVDHGLQRTSKRMEATVGVTGPQRLVIRMLGRFPGMNSGQLAQVLHVHPSTMTGIVQRLESRGLLVRRTDTQDRRRAFLGLTPKGRALDTEAGGTVEAAVAETLSKIPEHKVKVAREVLAALVAALETSPSTGG